MPKTITINPLDENIDLSAVFYLAAPPGDPNGTPVVWISVNVRTDGPGGGLESVAFVMTDVVNALSNAQRKSFLKACRDHALALLGFTP